jgi:YHS domain-containing protein
MKKQGLGAIIIFVLAGLFMLTDSSGAYARRTLLEDADNAICPVTQQSLARKKYNSAYMGKRYWFSSYNAVLEFDKNPEKYLRNLKGYKPAAASAKKAVSLKQQAQTTKPVAQEAAQETKRRGWLGR